MFLLKILYPFEYLYQHFFNLFLLYFLNEVDLKNVDRDLLKYFYTFYKNVLSLIRVMGNVKKCQIAIQITLLEVILQQGGTVGMTYSVMKTKYI